MTPVQEAHFRLMTGPLRDHVRTIEGSKTPVPTPGTLKGNVKPRAALRPEARHRSTAARRVKVGRRIFASLTQAAQAIHVSNRSLYRMIDRGEAEYAP